MIRIIALGLTALFALTSEARAEDLTAEEARQSLVGLAVIHHLPGGAYGTTSYGPDGTVSHHYSEAGVGQMGTYRIEPDGRLCWDTPAAGLGCFRYYREDGALHVRRDDPESSDYIGTMTIE